MRKLITGAIIMRLPALLIVLSVLFRFSSAVCYISENDGKSAGTDDPCHRFGDGDYECHCDGDVACDSVNGTCPGECADGWFGPACQYVSVIYNAFDGDDSLGWLTDKNDSTCNSDIQNFTIRLDNPTLLTWIRIVTHTPVQDNIGLAYDFDGDVITCPVKQAKVDNTTVDISCPTSGAVSELFYRGPEIGGVCSIYISGGTNLAFKDTAVATQSTTDNARYSASAAIDGYMYSNEFIIDNCAGVAPVQDDPNTVWWRLSFSEPVNINTIVAYPRSLSPSYAVNLKIDIYNETENKVSTTTDHEMDTYNIGVTDVKAVELLIPENSAGVALVLCEVEVYGDSPCGHGKYGLDCNKTCYCVNGDDCFDHSGACPAGCPDGYTGEGCSTPCEEGFYGYGCHETCSEFCAGDDHSCHHVTGSCDHGCENGYQPPMCKDVVETTTTPTSIPSTQVVETTTTPAPTAPSSTAADDGHDDDHEDDGHTHGQNCHHGDSHHHAPVHPGYYPGVGYAPYYAGAGYIPYQGYPWPGYVNPRFGGMVYNPYPTFLNMGWYPYRGWFPWGG